MYIFAVCDDEETFSRSISNLIDMKFREMHVPVEIYRYTNSESLLEQMKKGVHYDALFIDIDMPKLDGIRLCREYRAMGGDGLVIFVSNKEELVFQTFDVQPFRFVRKRYMYQEIDGIFQDITRELERRSEKWLRFENTYEDSVFSVNINRVMYVEARGKSSLIHSTNREDEIKVSFQKLMEQLAPLDFIQVHRSYLVNPHYIYQISSDAVILDGDICIPMSRRRRDAIKEAYFKWCQGE